MGNSTIEIVLSIIRSAGAVGLFLIGLVGVYFTWDEYQHTQPGIRVAIVETEIRRETMPSTVVATRLDQIRGRYSSIIGYPLKELIDKLNNGDLPKVDSELSGVINSIGTGVDSYRSELGELIGEVRALLDENVGLNEVKIALQSIEDKYSENTGYSILDAMKSTNIEAAREKLQSAISDWERESTHIEQDREAAVKEIEELRKEMTKVGKEERMVVSMLLENYRRQPALVRSLASMGVSEGEKSNPIPFAIYFDESVRLEPYSSHPVIARSRLLSSLGDDDLGRVRKNWETGLCAVLVKDIRGKRWLSAKISCEGGTDLERREVAKKELLEVWRST